MTVLQSSGRRAVTHWETLQLFEEDRLSLLELRLETGRTHQIRVHLAKMGHSVVGDPVYGSSGWCETGIRFRTAGVASEFGETGASCSDSGV